MLMGGWALEGYKKTEMDPMSRNDGINFLRTFLETCIPFFS